MIHISLFLLINQYNEHFILKNVGFDDETARGGLSIKGEGFLGPMISKGPAIFISGYAGGADL